MYDVYLLVLKNYSYHVHYVRILSKDIYIDLLEIIPAIPKLEVYIQ